MISIGEDVFLVREIDSTRVYEIYAGKAILLRNLLSPETLFDRNGVVGAALYACRVSVMTLGPKDVLKLT